MQEAATGRLLVVLLYPKHMLLWSNLCSALHCAHMVCKRLCLHGVQEAATAWKSSRPLVVMLGCSGLTAALAGQRLDSRGGSSRPPILGAHTAQEAVALIKQLLAGQPCPAYVSKSWHIGVSGVECVSNTAAE